MRSLLPTLTLLLVSAAVGPAACDPAKLPTVTDLTHSGNGCPQDTTVVQAGTNFNDLAFVMSSFATESGTTENCAVHFNAVDTTPGWRVGLRNVYVTGWQVLPAGGGELELYMQAFWSQDAADTQTRTIKMENPGARKAETKTLVFDFTNDMLWSPCSGGDGYLGIFNANFRAVSSPGAYFGSKGSAETTEYYEWEWREC